MFTYITSNVNKIKSATERLSKEGIEFRHESIDLVEIQSRDTNEIAHYKLKFASKQIKGAILINDVEWRIPALNGFPGPYAHDVFKWLDEKDILRLMNELKDRRIILNSTLGYKDNDTEIIFNNEREGEILKVASGIGKFNLDRIISFRADKLSIAYCEDNSLEKHDDKSSAWDKFIEWYFKK
ncbi:MAG: non-canonical purine NTP pyrophosphatase [Candidatus Dojkabacteria bacterium]|nr:non-canonical purine NTP pyrophosphatase [Candidatus Dojkabacteria bacterium]MDQ7020927.1 non-canonical purine NTP pyrophosphatase [Candidatus Dojkabacteria bacterium]